MAFALLGVMSAASMVHELYHKWDFRDVAKNGQICILEYPSIVGTYRFDYSNVNKNLVEKRNFSSEIIAYGISAIMILMFIIAFVYQVVDYKKNGNIK